MVYNAKTPDLYPNNSHHQIGWVSICVAVARIAIALTRSLGDLKMGRSLPHKLMGQHRHCQSISSRDRAVDSYTAVHNDAPASSRNSSMSGSTDCEEDFSEGSMTYRYAEADRIQTEKRSLLHETAVVRVPSRVLLRTLQKAARVVNVLSPIVDHAILLTGFLAITTGIVVYGGIFVGRRDYHITEH